MNNMYPSNPLGIGNTGFNPYLTQLSMNPVIPNYQPVQQSGPRMQIDTVNGKESAYAYNIGPNSSVLLADNMNPKIWMVTTDSSGYKMVKGFKIIPDEEEEQTVTATVEDSESKQKIDALLERVDKLEERINEYGQSNYQPAYTVEPDDADSRSNVWSSKNGKGSNGRR